MYNSLITNLQEEIKDTALSAMKAAGEEEKSLTKESGSIDKNCIPLITVVVDA